MNPNHNLGVPRASVDVEQEHPLPWHASEVSVSFNGLPTLACRVTRCPGDVIRLDLDGLCVPPDTPARIQWTQAGQGGYAAGVVVASTDGAAGVHVRIEESIAGVDRRLGVRVPVRLPAALTLSEGVALHCHIEDLSLGGARVALAADQESSPSSSEGREIPLSPTGQATIDILLPDGAARFRCSVARTDQGPSHLRLRFVDVDADMLDRVALFLRAEHFKIALRRSAISD